MYELKGPNKMAYHFFCVICR